MINIDLKDKPEWYIAKNPLGKVPLLEEKGVKDAIFESLIIAEYVDDKFHAKNPILPADSPLERAQQKMLVEVIHGKVLICVSVEHTCVWISKSSLSNQLI